MDADRQGPETFDAVDQDGVVEDGLVGPVGVEQGLGPFGAGATAGGEFLGQQPVGGGGGDRVDRGEGGFLFKRERRAHKLASRSPSSQNSILN